MASITSQKFRNLTLGRSEGGLPAWPEAAVARRLPGRSGLAAFAHPALHDE